MPAGPAANFNEVLATAGDGDLGGGADGTIGGKALTQDDPNTIAIEGVVTFGIRSPVSGTYDIRVFVEEPAGDNGNDDREADEPGTSAIGIFTAEGGHTGVADRSAAARVQSLGCKPEKSSKFVLTIHRFTCRATSSSGVPVINALVSFDVVRGPNRQEFGPTPCGSTGLTGIANCSYIDPRGRNSRPGTDVIRAYSEVDPQTTRRDPGAARDMIRNTFLPVGPIHRNRARVTFKRDFSGAIHSAIAGCRKHRTVIIRKVKAGRDPIVRRVKTSNTGDFGASKPKGSRLYWAFAKKTSFPTQAGVRVICLPNKAFVRT